MDLLPLPLGYQRIMSLDAGYALAIPSSWVYVISDGPLTVAQQVAAIQADHPELEALLANQSQMVGGMVKLVVLDSEPVAISGNMVGNLISMTPVPTSNLTATAKALARQIESTYRLEAGQVKSELIELPFGSVIQLDYTMSTSGAFVRLVQYVFPGVKHTYTITLGAPSAAFTSYQARFAAVAATFQEI